MQYTGTETIRSSIFAKMLDEQKQTRLVDHMEVSRQARANPENREWALALNALRQAKRATES
jgi:hypothetical protein